MNALFPQGKDYKNKPFIQEGNASCLELVGSDNLNTKFPIYWRGRDNSVIGEVYVGGSLFDANFTAEKLDLKWANGELAEFFWKVYNDTDCVKFNSRDEVMETQSNQFGVNQSQIMKPKYLLIRSVII